jgi:5-methylphenazine-1-carboxylate 1-monooxygenase
VKVLIAGAGIGGLTTALSLHQAGIEVQVFERVREMRELGVGINMLPHAVKELAALGLLSGLDQAGIRTRELILANRFGQPVWREPRGMYAGYNMPQISIHRGRLQGVLYSAVLERLGPAAVHTGHTLVGVTQHANDVVAHIERRSDGAVVSVEGDVVVGADGIHSRVRDVLYPDEGPPIWNGVMLWRGATEWPTYADGQTMVIAGGNTAKFALYPIHVDPARPDMRLTNWAIMAKVSDAGETPPRREDWSRPGRLDEVLPFVRNKFRFDFVDPVALIQATDLFYEYPNCDRNPLERWSFGRITLLGDAAHPMYPVGSNGASQAILDARALTRCLTSGASVVEALAAYDAERRPPTSEIVTINRLGGPERVIDAVEARAPSGFDDVEAVLSHAEREAIVRGYAHLAGYAVEQVNAAPSD